MTRRIVVDRNVSREVFLHEILHDIFSQIDRRFEEIVSDTISGSWRLEAVNALIILALLNEGWINAIGQKKIGAWKHRDSAEKRFSMIFSELLSGENRSARPLSSIETVRKIRNEFGHAKPLIEKRTDREVIVDDADHSNVFRELVHPIEFEITIESYRVLRNDSADFRKLVLEKSGLGYWEIKTRSEEHSTYIREAD